MEQSGLMERLLPELASCRGIDQRGYHRFDVLDHSLLACDYAAQQGFSREVRWAALLHDLGKPLVRRLVGDRWTFHRHEAESVRICREVLSRYRYPTGVIGRVSHLVEEHMFHYEPEWNDGAVRRFLVRVGTENLEELFQLRRADSYAALGIEPPADLLLPLRERIEAVMARGKALSLKDLTISGRDLLDAGFEPGRRIGIILQELLEAVLSDPALNRKEKLLEIAEHLRA
jgi:putative nucleotidyltransferase with HDIG domain